MEALIKQVVALEQKAKDSVKTVRARQEKLDEEIAGVAAAIESDITRKMNKRLDEIRSMETNEGRDRVEAITKNAAKSLADIRNKYEQNKKVWEDDLFKKIIGR